MLAAWLCRPAINRIKLGARMRTHSLLSDVMGRMYRVPGAKMGKVSAKLHARIEAWPTDYHIKRLIQWHWFLKSVTHGVDFLSAGDVVENEAKYGHLKSGFLQIADCGNGDRVFVRESDFSVWYWDHESATDWDAVEPKARIVVYPSLDLLMIAVASLAFVPCDSCSAREYAQLMKVPRIK